MRSIRLIFTLAACLLSVGFFTGCTSMKGSDGKLTEESFNSYVATHETDIKMTADITTVAVLATVKNDNQRAELARKLSDVATSLETMVATEDLDLSGLRAYAERLLTDQDFVNRDLAALVVRSVADLIESKNRVYFADLTASTRTQGIRILIRAASGGVKSATASYTLR